MQVNNQVLSLTGSLLADPTRPPPPPAPVAPLRAVSPSPSPSPEPPTKVARVQRTETQRTDGRQKTNGGAQRKQPTASTDQANEADQVDDRFLSQRELKKKRKEEEKRKRDERKARKEERVLEEVAEAGDEEMVGMSGVLNEENVGSKRKGGETGGEAAERKKTKYRS
ncbi:hypothetical protein BD324DRAFT_130386 [Kockovaella imperatae]|uniref:Uncharacterized protein n=1 Tax=Kockovaella imperatae TaxID=4999 RepID=A0A1Y1U9M3_9TREE|nr:hypothetical protein BD324DRAFT_130386 [Kockovaella imperatae]ORX34733.1 hypothetical protein BD324DRAFT_130386 [Kockovaella imperatae]